MLQQLMIGDDLHAARISSFNDTDKRHMSFLSVRDRQMSLCHKDDMENDAKLYRLLMSIKPDNLTENAWLRRADVSRNIFQSIRKGARPRTDTLEKLVTAVGYSPAQFYELEGRAPDAEPTPAPSELPFRRRDERADIPLVGTAQGSDFEVDEDGKITFVEKMDLDFENVVDHVRRPASLANRKDVYAITVVGSSMAEKYEDGDPAYVDPHRQPKAGDYVVVQLIKRDGDGEGRVSSALLKRLVKKTSQMVELEQNNPKCRFTVSRSEVAHIHRVIPWAEIVFF